MKTITTVLILSAFALCSADVDVPGNDFSTNYNQGGYHFFFNDGRQARQEERTPEGIVRGAYRYIDANGEIQTADSHNGFVASGSNIAKIGRIPQPTQEGEIIEVPPASIVEDTPELKTAKVEHFEAHQGVLLEGNKLAIEELPIPVQYTPEVSAARSQHFNAFNHEQLRSLNYYPSNYVSQPSIVQYVIPSDFENHPDYLPYAAL